MKNFKVEIRETNGRFYPLQNEINVAFLSHPNGFGYPEQAQSWVENNQDKINEIMSLEGNK